MTQEEQILKLLQSIIKGSEWENKVFLVGGAVRDQIMGKPPKDLDFVVQGNISAGINFSTWLAQRLKVYKEGSNPVIYPTFGTSKLSYNSIDMEFVAPRKEQYTAGSRKPQVSGGVLMDDSLRRDLTINSLMRNVSTNEVLDLTGKGLNDIKQGIIRTPSDPKIIFREDPLRMLRAIRFTVKYGFKIDKGVIDNITKYAQWIETISKERISDELNKILVTNNPSKGFELLKNTGLLKYIIPELDSTVGMEQNIHHTEDVFQHTMSVLKNTPPDLLTRLMALFHDIGKVPARSVNPEGDVHFYGHEDASGEMTKKIMTRLKYPNDLINAVALGVKSHMAFKHGEDDISKLSDKSLRKFSTLVGGHLQNVLDLIHADNISHAEKSAMPNQVPLIRQRMEKLKAPTIKSDIKLPINGNDVIGMGVKQGPLVGKIMDAVQDAWYENPDLTREEALKIVNDMKLKNEINEIRRIMYGNIIQEDKISYIGNFELKQDPFSQHYNVEISNVSKKVSSFDSEFDPISNEKIQALVDKLIRLQMITLIGGITDYTNVSIEIWEIDEDSGLYIETYHQLDDDEGLSDYDATMKYSDFLEK